jgi:hypothetical protein
MTMENQTASRNEDGRLPAFAEVTGSVAPWKVHVTVCGANAGDYEHPNFAEAKAMVDERNAKFGVLGCHYRLIAPANECRCCGKSGVYVRTRYFEDSESDVWECTTEGCENHGLIWHTDRPRNTELRNAPGTEK